ncbi:hypothetical protein ACFQ6N_29535 [Kitasatospora sp. NPDC056446]|uniref:hypothetical protein n=1 Tax=Kitasatospora sp. NPDC056446 TaxID=3345819 RepID=UPI0036B4C383
MIGAVSGPGEWDRLLVMLVDGRRLVTAELSEQERAELGAPVAGRLRQPHPGARSVVRWLRPVLAVVVELEAGRVRRIAVPAEGD